ncbi:MULTISPECIES: hypothetical protein [unclassified Streptomyces]|nr:MULTISPECIES: hypothetical protein [unclassified Streptomyces]MCX4792995.1 hypothetical protein [Streptomyces sp. NBC_01242]WSP60890.1 hypothetical protein OG466_02510 [Streptomyces sp. NBC_01240]
MLFISLTAGYQVTLGDDNVRRRGKVGMSSPANRSYTTPDPTVRHKR